MNYANTGYYFAAALFTFFAILMLISWRGRLQGGLLIAMACLTVVWALVTATVGHSNQSIFPYANALEVLRNLAAFAFLLELLKPLYRARGQMTTLTVMTVSLYVVIVWLLFASFQVVNYFYLPDNWFLISFEMMFGANMLMSVVGLILLAVLYRNTRSESRPSFKYLFYGFGLIFVYDIFMYLGAIYQGMIDNEIWIGRGLIVSFSVPFLTLAAQRNPNWSIEVFVSKQLVFHTATFLAVVLYIMLMAIAGYYIKSYAGEWGGMAQIVFWSVSLLLLISALYSEDLKAQIKVFINKHFFNYKYDHRIEWTNLTKELSKANEGENLHVTVINSIAGIIGSSGGMLWLLNREKTGYNLVANTAFKNIDEVESIDGPFAQFLYQRDWIIDLKEMRRSPQLYTGLQIPGWLQREPEAWLVISLRHQNELYGFLILNESKLFSQINWEDRDLLNTACMQAVSYLAFQEASDSLARSEKFAVFNRLSAYVVHDLKNLIAQLELITSNAKKFKNNPEFVDDAFDTVENASQKMAHLLTQLKQGRFSDQSVSMVDIENTIKEVVRNHQIYKPVPELHCELKNVRILVNHDRFVSIVGHIVKNAQEASDDDGYVFIDVTRNNEFVKIKVTDNGCGMSDSFIREKLFNPFITTKGNAGMGVGVYECREYIQSVGGNIDVVSILGRGTEITLSVPVVNLDSNNYERIM